MDDDCKVRSELVNPVTADEFDKVEIVNEHMHAWISHNKVDENYVDVNFDEDNLRWVVSHDAIERSNWYVVIWREKPTGVWKPSGRQHVCNKERGL